MKIQSVQKIIKIGANSKGVTLPARDLKAMQADLGDEVEITAKKIRKTDVTTADVVETAKTILAEYRQDFENLSRR